MHLFLTFLLGMSLMVQSCTSAKTTKDNFPAQIDYPNYELIDARHTTDMSLTAKQNSKLAIVVRNLAVTAYTNLETPVYDKKMVAFEGVDRCCVPNGMMGSSGLMVYRFRILRKGDTTIQLIARHKGFSERTPRFDNDIVTSIKLKIE